jgi:hypothetical protein
MQNRRKAKARAVAASRPDWMPQPLVLSVILGLWTAATAIHLFHIH